MKRQIKKPEAPEKAEWNESMDTMRMAVMTTGLGDEDEINWATRAADEVKEKDSLVKAEIEKQHEKEENHD